MITISKQQLKQEIENLDSRYLELVYNILRQFPHDKPKPVTRRKPSAKIAGKGRILGDIMSPVSVAEDWDALR